MENNTSIFNTRFFKISFGIALIGALSMYVLLRIFANPSLQAFSMVHMLCILIGGFLGATLGSYGIYRSAYKVGRACGDLSSIVLWHPALVIWLSFSYGFAMVISAAYGIIFPAIMIFSVISAPHTWLTILLITACVCVLFGALFIYNRWALRLIRNNYEQGCQDAIAEAVHFSQQATLETIQDL